MKFEVRPEEWKGGWKPVSAVETDPVAALLLDGRAATLAGAEELYLDTHLDEVIALASSSLSDGEFRRHPLVTLLLARGSRGWEDSLV